MALEIIISVAAASFAAYAYILRLRLSKARAENRWLVGKLKGYEGAIDNLSKAYRDLDDPDKRERLLNSLRVVRGE